jgi:hypothetical protein
MVTEAAPLGRPVVVQLITVSHRFFTMATMTIVPPTSVNVLGRSPQREPPPGLASGRTSPSWPRPLVYAGAAAIPLCFTRQPEGGVPAQAHHARLERATSRLIEAAWRPS